MQVYLIDLQRVTGLVCVLVLEKRPSCWLDTSSTDGECSADSASHTQSVLEYPAE